MAQSRLPHLSCSMGKGITMDEYDRVNGYDATDEYINKDRHKAQMAREALRDAMKEAQGNGYSHELWRLLTALRGPDSGDPHVKRMMTTPIRCCVLTMNMAQEIGVDDLDYFKEEPPNIVGMEDEAQGLWQAQQGRDGGVTNAECHFHNHYLNALWVLKDAARYVAPTEGADE